ncbi:type II toxin-antitoxin system RelB/DinJ family antitoxin [Acetobacter persici]|uniref:type II toxin-antitoxin system RelB/DinJ family antitoxin n=1 Tax=Acetobacter persici TaxID=1076596 RepID=UPI001BA95DB8|nr:type II toxin-antitoxin system RelB/DinJ family antitoxin [Acetobacter persici]MBS1016882.1 type II toxin-antitoxin system RelB/DinJ family antitoxin [Acetobacter persici]MCP9321028.1 type II toxin-antitoxin system RelB/DinJ family antitoxin [Acetobacter persici]
MSATNEFSQISLRVPVTLKENAFAQIKAHGMTPTEVFRDVLEYIVREGKMPVRKEILSDEDAELLVRIKQALADDDEMIDVKPRDLRAALQL